MMIFSPVYRGRSLACHDWKNSTISKAFHVETPRDLQACSSFYRLELRKRGWSEIAEAVIKPGAP